MMVISYAVSVYDIKSSTKLFTIYLVYGHIFMANICAQLPFSSFLGAISGFTSAKA